MSTKQNEKVGFLAKTKKFLKASQNELKKVHWSNKKELTKYTVVVVVSTIVVSTVIWIIDSLLSLVIGQFI